MINLIPNQEKKKIIRDFYQRLAVLAIFMLSVAVFIAILALLPAYFFSKSQNSIAIKKLEIQKSNPIPDFDEETRKIIKDTNDKLYTIESAQVDKFVVSEKVVNAIIKKKIPSIKIIQISYESETKDGKKIVISGTAPSRDVLLLFRQTLEQSKAFKSVDLPISNFVKGSNIEFYLTLIP